MTAMATARAAAFFDLDKTLIPGSSLFLLARGLYERDMFRVRDIMQFAFGQAVYRLGGERRRGMDMSRESTLEFVTGRSQAELAEWVAATTAQVLSNPVFAVIAVSLVLELTGAPPARPSRGAS